MPIDYEAEYNNRARVPEHPEIFARWAREAEDYRAEAMKERRAELGLSYGSSLRQFIDLFSPRGAITAPLALFIHGGYWRSLDPSLFSQVARGLNAHGVAVAVVGYDLCPEVTIAEIIEQIRHACLFLWLRTSQRMMIYGHSAGGHLAGALESSEFLRQSRTLAEQWGTAGVQTRYEAIAGTNHFTVIDGLADPQNAMVARLAELASRPEMTGASAKRGG